MGESQLHSFATGFGDDSHHTHHELLSDVALLRADREPDAALVGVIGDVVRKVVGAKHGLEVLVQSALPEHVAGARYDRLREPAIHRRCSLAEEALPVDVTYHRCRSPLGNLVVHHLHLMMRAHGAAFRDAALAMLCERKP